MADQSVIQVSRLVDERGLYQIALPVTHLRRSSELLAAIQVFDLIYVSDATIPA